MPAGIINNDPSGVHVGRRKKETSPSSMNKWCLVMGVWTITAGDTGAAAETTASTRPATSVEDAVAGSI